MQEILKNHEGESMESVGLRQSEVDAIRKFLGLGKEPPEKRRFMRFDYKDPKDGEWKSFFQAIPDIEEFFKVQTTDAQPLGWHCRVIYVWSSNPEDLTITKETIRTLQQGGRRQVQVSEVKKKDEGPKIEVLEDDEDQKPKLPQIEGPRSKIEDVDSQCIFCGDIATRMKKFNNKIKICDKIKCEKKLF